MNDEPETGFGRNIKRALTWRNAAVAVLLAVVLGFLLVCFGVLPL